MSNRAERVAAALSAWRIETEPGDAMPSMASVKAAGDALAALLREPQPDPAAVGGEDEALLSEADGCCPLDTEPKLLIGRLATRLRAALDDVARLQETVDRQHKTLCDAAQEMIDLKCDLHDALEAHHGDLYLIGLGETDAGRALDGLIALRKEVGDRFADDDLNMETIRSRRYSAMKERDAARAALAAVEFRLLTVIEERNRAQAELAAIRARAGRNDG